MTIKEVIIGAATLAGEEKTAKALIGTETADDKEILGRIDLLTRLANLVIGETAATYIPLKTEEKVGTADGKVYYADLKKNAVKILGVYDEFGDKLAFKHFGEYFSSSRGTLSVVYAYSPSNLGLDDDAGYTERDVSANVLSYGVAAEYCLTQGRFDEAVMWRERYSDGIEAFCLPENRRTKRRGWL